MNSSCKLLKQKFSHYLFLGKHGKFPLMELWDSWEAAEDQRDVCTGKMGPSHELLHKLAQGCPVSLRTTSLDPPTLWNKLWNKCILSKGILEAKKLYWIFSLRDLSWQKHFYNIWNLAILKAKNKTKPKAAWNRFD